MQQRTFHTTKTAIDNGIVYIDIGELGWSFYLSAHVRWLKRTSQREILVITYPDRLCLYKRIVDYVKVVPVEFGKFSSYQQDGFGLLTDTGQKLHFSILRKFFEKYIENGFVIAKDQSFSCKYFPENEMIFESYSPSNNTLVDHKILIFPRCRRHPRYKWRNLSKSFYIDLITKLCDTFNSTTIITFGTKEGAYSFDEVVKPNYVDLVGKSSLEEVINECSNAVVAIGSASSLPKLSLLQGVPTFIIGHQKERCIKENWMKTRMMFYEVPSNGYESFKDSGCIDQIIGFIKEEKE